TLLAENNPPEMLWFFIGLSQAQNSAFFAPREGPLAMSFLARLSVAFCHIDRMGELSPNLFMRKPLFFSILCHKSPAARSLHSTQGIAERFPNFTAVSWTEVPSRKRQPERIERRCVDGGETTNLQ